MSAQHPEGVARKACRRCSTQKKRCDKALPECGLCVRLSQICKYENVPSSTLPPSPSVRPEFILSPEAFTISHIKSAIMQKIGLLELESTILRYSRAIDPCFPIISITRLQSRLQHMHKWDEAPLDLSILCLSIVLLTTSPPSSPEDDSNLSDFKSLYLCIKSWIALIEGFGVNSLEMLQARVLVTLFEVTHGFYPAAHISIGSVIRAADALVVHPEAENSLSHYPRDEVKRQDTLLTWCGITTLDRYIAIESKTYAPLTSSYTHPTYTPLEPHLYPTHTVSPDRAAPLYRFSRLFEASSLLDKFHITLYDPTAEYLFNVEEITLIVKTLNSLKLVLLGEIIEGREVYSAAVGICDILLLAFETGSKVSPVDGLTSNCLSLGMKHLNSLISSITSKVEIFTLSNQPHEFDLLPPPIMFLAYKTASIVTRRLWIDNELSEGVRRLRILRGFLKLVGRRWLCCERYLKLLDEDTTPRILKAIEQG